LGTAAVLFLLSLACAALMDVKKNVVPNRIWIPAIAAFPIAVYRLALAQLLLLYTLQAAFTFVLVLLCFHLGLLGGADGKAILFASLAYPWLETECLLLTVGSALIYVGAWVIAGVQSLSLALLNLIEWHRCAPPERPKFHPQKKRFWFTRRLSLAREPADQSHWRQVAVPFVSYVLVAYLMLLLCTQLV
jgi:Flp pilus assembly protein protease CpaA